MPQRRGRPPGTEKKRGARGEAGHSYRSRTEKEGGKRRKEATTLANRPQKHEHRGEHTNTANTRITTASTTPSNRKLSPPFGRRKVWGGEIIKAGKL